MIKGKLTSDKKALINARKQADAKIKKALKPVGQALKEEVKSKAPKDSGALSRSIKDKEISKKGKASVVVGPDSKYQYKGKTPNKYSAKAQAQTGFMTVDHNKYKDKINKALKDNL